MVLRTRLVGLTGLLIFGLILLGGCATSSSPASNTARPWSSALPNGPVSHVGRWLVDQSGRVLLFHGVNMVDKTAPFYPSSEGFSTDDAQWLAQSGFRVVRLGILATGLMPSPGVVSQSYINQIAKTVNLLGSHGIYTLVDFHQDGYGPSIGSDGFPSWMVETNGKVNNGVGFPLYYIANPAVRQAFQSFWDDQRSSDGRGLEQDYGIMFKAVARKFANNPYVLGYDLFNEPWPGNVWKSCLYNSNGCPGLTHQELDKAYSIATKAIRSTGDHHLIFGEPFVLFNFGMAGTTLSLPGNDKNSGMSFHMYTLTPSREPDVISNAISWSKKTGGALLNTEWATSNFAPDAIRQSSELDQALLPWIYWSFDGGLVKDVLQPPTGANLVGGDVTAVVQPYPLAVAGTPLSFSYVNSDRTLTFSWSTTGVGSKGLSPHAVTSFEVPSEVYPNGYLLSITGGKILSKPCVSIVELKAYSGARKVTVTISPGPSSSCAHG